MEKFRKLGLDDSILESIQELGFTEPTDVQKVTIPLVIAGRDVIAGSATGSGKTLAFAGGMLNNIKKGEGIQALILAPTRELAEQISQTIRKFSKKKLIIMPIYGGVGINPQITALQKTEIVVGTPGRILDHVERGTIDFSKIKYVVLDEADRMLDMGFIPDVTKIMKLCPVERQTLFFSATIQREVERLAERFMRDPKRVSLETYVDPKKLSQIYYDVPGNLKFSLLAKFLKDEVTNLVMVFCNSRRNTDYVAKGLNKIGIEAVSIHGGLTQHRRNQVIAKFHSNNVFVLVCTDVAARGLDIPNVSHVYNYDIPQDSKQYIHRIGRTARAGKSGQVVNLLARQDYENYDAVLRDNDLHIPKGKRPYLEKIELNISTDRKPGQFRNYGSQNNGRGRSNNRRPKQGNRGSSHRSSGPKTYKVNTSNNASLEE